MTLSVLLLAAQLTDPRMATKIDVRVKIAPIDEAVAALGKAGKISLETSPSIRDLKATILVDKMPLGRVMARLADVLRMQWQKEGSIYRLVNDPDAASREAGYLKAESEIGKSSLEKKLRAMAEASRVPFRELEEETQNQLLAVGKLAPDSQARKDATSRLGALNNAQNLDVWLQGRLLNGLGADGWKRLMAGEPMSASTQPAGHGIALPADATTYPRWRGETIQGSPRTRLDIFLRIDPSSWTLQTRHDDAGVSGQVNSMSRSGSGYAMPNGYWDLQDTPFVKEVVAWNQFEFKDPAVGLKCDPKTSERPSEWWTGYYSDADQFEWLHNASGVPIVAMATRVPNRRSSLSFNGTVGDYLKSWREKWGGAGYFHLDDGFVMYRPADFWHVRRAEIPEASLRPLEAKESPTLDDYAEFVTRVSDRQAAMAGETYQYLLRVSPFSFSDGLPILRLWGALTRSQRERLRAEGGVPYAALGGSARTAFERAVTDVFAGAWHRGPMASRFTGAGLGSFASWGIQGETKDIHASGRSRPRPLDDVSVNTAMEPESDGISILLGTSKSDSVAYTLPLVGLPKKR